MTDINELLELSDIENDIELLIGELYSKFYKLRELKAYQTEYDIMGSLSVMLIEDRALIRQKYRDQLNQY